jgi:predicted nucleotidyltransferase
MPIHPDILARREEILRICALHGARNVRVFGSMARGDARPDSDLDLLVDFEQGTRLMDLSRLIIELQRLVARGVDVADPGSVHWTIRDEVVSHAVPL